MTVQHNWLADSVTLTMTIAIAVALDVADELALEDDPSGEGYSAYKDIPETVSITEEIGITADA